MLSLFENFWQMNASVILMPPTISVNIFTLETFINYQDNPAKEKIFES